MPRRYYSRRTRVVRPKKKWASNIGQLNYSITSGNLEPGKILVQNTSQSSNPTPTVIKAGNFKASVDVVYTFSTAPATLPNCTVYILFLPEGITVPDITSLGTLVNNHPEYVMAWRKMDFDYVANGGSFSGSSVTLSSRLKRNLNSGDKIYFGVYAMNSGARIQVQGTVQFWTCSN